MSNTWTERWNERYSNEAYAYGQDPNDFLKQELKKMNKQRNPLDKKKASQEDFSDDLLIYSTNPNIIVNYDDELY